MRRYRALLAPGTPVRAGLERILHGRTGALIVLGNNDAVRRLSTGGFVIDVEFTPTALRELAKMDGAIIISSDFERIVQAGVHLVPDGRLPTLETGTRHRTADRLAQQAGVPVVTVSSSMSTIALFIGGERYAIEDSDQILARADQALSALARYRDRLGMLTRTLTAREVQDSVTVADLVRVVKTIETIRRLDTELRAYVAALGIDGRLVELQLFDLTAGVDEMAGLLERDYQSGDYQSETPDEQVFRLSRLARLETTELLNQSAVVHLLGLDKADEASLHPRGHRLLGQLSRVPPSVANRLVDHFGSLQALLGATTADLMAVEGIGEQRARIVREGLASISEQAFTGEVM